MATFVIVHGAWGGSWAWNRDVVPRLRALGHEVHAPQLTGLGERAHLASPDISLDTHITDVVNVLYYNDLTDVILAGHSYGGMVITGVADRVPERLRRLVYMDAAVPSDGQSIADLTPGRRQQLVDRAQQEGDGWRIPPGPMQRDDPAEIQTWAAPRRHGQPIKTFLDPVRLERGETRLPRAFVYCAGGKEPDSPFTIRALQVRADPRWMYYELSSGHNLHYSAPDETVRILIEQANGVQATGRRSRQPRRPPHSR